MKVLNFLYRYGLQINTVVLILMMINIMYFQSFLFVSVLTAISIFSLICIIIISIKGNVHFTDDQGRRIECIRNYKKSLDNGEYNIEYQIFYKGYPLTRGSYNFYPTWNETNKELEK